MTLQKIMSFLDQYGRVLFAVAVIGLPVLSGIIKEMRQNAAKKRAILDRERQLIEEMRRGKAATASSTPLAESSNNAANQLEEMARRRREQVEQARGRQVQATQAQAGGRVQQAPIGQRPGRQSTTPPVPKRNAPTPPVTPQPQRQTAQQRQQRAAQQRAANQQQQRSQPSQPARRPEPIQPVKRSASEAVRIAQMSSEAHDRLHDAKEVTHRLVADVADAPARDIAGRHISRNEWRRA